VTLTAQDLATIVGYVLSAYAVGYACGALFQTVRDMMSKL